MSLWRPISEWKLLHTSFSCSCIWTHWLRAARACPSVSVRLRLSQTPSRKSDYLKCKGFISRLIAFRSVFLWACVDGLGSWGDGHWRIWVLSLAALSASLPYTPLVSFSGLNNCLSQWVTSWLSLRVLCSNYVWNKQLTSAVCTVGRTHTLKMKHKPTWRLQLFYLNYL